MSNSPSSGRSRFRPNPLSLLLVIPGMLGVMLLTGSDHSSSLQRNSLRQSPAQRPTTVIARDGCVTAECHSEVKQNPFLHGPLYVNACDACHELTDAAQHSYKPARPTEQLCTYCHEFDFPELGSSHEPAASGECVACHDPHGGAERTLLRAGPYEDLCNNCHAESRGGTRLAHHPDLTGSCRSCHEPHASSNQKLLKVAGRDLCLGCHVVTGLQLDLLHVAHPPAQGDCLTCHDPHATDTPGMLIRDPQALCTGCHTGIASTISESTSQHAAVTGERACLNCHDPHASDHARLLKQETMPLCLECHDRTLEREEGGAVMNIQRELERGAALHGPVAEGDCVACHQIHGGDFDRLLKREYSTGAYSTFEDNSYSLCFECHDRSLAEEPTTNVVTGFRNGTQNLHHTHVSQQEKGRTCHVCHDPHAGSSEHHIRRSVPYGPSGWELPIAWSATTDGGSCAAACHAALEYNRATPVEYLDTPGGSKPRWPKAKGAPEESGGTPDDSTDKTSKPASGASDDQPGERRDNATHQ